VSDFPDKASGHPATLMRISSIRGRLLRSHLAAVTASTFVYASGGFFLLVVLLILAGYTFDVMARIVPQLLGLTLFVLVQIVLITLCGVVVARIVSSMVSRPMLAQIAELEAGSNAIAKGDLGRRVAVLTNDELGRLATRFNFLTDQLGAAERQRRAFVANISHDLRTPIAIIRGHLDAQLDGHGVADISPAMSFAAIDNELQTLSRLVEDLFAASRLDEGVMPVATGAVDLAELARQAVKGIRAYALNHARVSVNVQVPADGLPLARGDATKITQVLNNLLHNAVRHTPEGGIVIVQVEPEQGHSWIHVTVRDTGVGIPPESLEHIFERYYQGESIHASGGSGLGLSIVRKLVEMQGGNVGIESTVGVGTAVSFRLPADRGSGGKPLVNPPSSPRTR
jgi:two-component system, OmpR family, sensor histidine kinase BaeS